MPKEAVTATKLLGELDNFVVKALNGDIVTSDDLASVNLGGITSAIHQNNLLEGFESWEISLGGASPLSEKSAHVFVSKFTDEFGNNVFSRTVSYKYDYDTFVVGGHKVSSNPFEKDPQTSGFVDWNDGAYFGYENYQNGELVNITTGVNLVGIRSYSDFDLPMINWCS